MEIFAFARSNCNMLISLAKKKLFCFKKECVFFYTCYSYYGTPALKLGYPLTTRFTRAYYGEIMTFSANSQGVFLPGIKKMI